MHGVHIICTIHVYMCVYNILIRICDNVCVRGHCACVCVCVCVCVLCVCVCVVWIGLDWINLI